MAAITRLGLYGGPEQRYGSFAGKAVEILTGIVTITARAQSLTMTMPAQSLTLSQRIQSLTLTVPPEG